MLMAREVLRLKDNLRLGMYTKIKLSSLQIVHRSFSDMKVLVPNGEDVQTPGESVLLLTCD